MTRNAKRFLTLYNLIRMWDESTSDYYLSTVTDENGELYEPIITESILLEMETNLIDCVSEIHSCDIER